MTSKGGDNEHCPEGAQLRRRKRRAPRPEIRTLNNGRRKSESFLFLSRNYGLFFLLFKNNLALAEQQEVSVSKLLSYFHHMNCSLTQAIFMLIYKFRSIFSMGILLVTSLI
jgi:hypothetical protein